MNKLTSTKTQLPYEVRARQATRAPSRPAHRGRNGGIRPPFRTPTRSPSPARGRARHCLTRLSSRRPQWYDLPFCRPAEIVYKGENLGEVMRGDRIQNSPFEIRMNVEESCKLLCKQSYTDAQVAPRAPRASRLAPRASPAQPASGGRRSRPKQQPTKPTNPQPHAS